MRNILLRVLCGAALLLPATVLAQSRDISGRVMMSGSGAPLPDATITVFGQQAGARSNERGEFRVRVTGGAVTQILEAQ